MSPPRVPEAKRETLPSESWESGEAGPRLMVVVCMCVCVGGGVYPRSSHRIEW